MTTILDKFKITLIATAGAAGAFIIVANSAIWANRYLVDTDNFTGTAVTSLTSKSSTDALANDIVDTALADYPVARRLVGDTATNFVSSLLGSSQMERAVGTVVSRLQILLTSPQRQPIVVNLEGVKSTVQQLINLSGRGDEAKVDVDKVPNEITLLDPSNLPNFNQYIVTLSWLSPLAGLLAIGLLAWPYMADSKRYREIMAIQGGALILTGLLGLLIGPLFRPLVLSDITNPNLRIVVTNLYNAFTATFNSQTMYIIWAGVLAVAISAGITVYNYYKLSKKSPKK